MKKLNIVLTLVIILSSAFVSYKSFVKETFTVSAAESEVHWYAKKVTGKHDGTVTLKSGALDIENNKLVGGNFVIDMTSIKVTDIPESEGSNKKLVGHLKSADFFDTENHPTAELKITKVEKTGKQAVTDKAQEYKVNADLTIKGNTNPVEFIAFVKVNKGSAIGRTTLTFDRSKFDIRYGSETFFGSLGDKAIYNDVELKINLKASKVAK